MKPALLPCLVLAICVSGCDLGKKFDAGIEAFRKVGTEASDVGLISELGWLSKLLRDSAAGTLEEQQKARNAVAKLFDVDEASLGKELGLEVTVQLSGYELKPDQPLEIDLKYVDSVSVSLIQAIFLDGTGWNPLRMGDPYNFQRDEKAIDALVSTRIDALLGRESCSPPSLQGDSFSGGSRFVQKCGFTGPLFLLIKGQTVDKNNDYLKRTQSARDQLKALIKAPYEVMGMPAAGTFQGQHTRSWGLTNIGYFAVVFVPKSQVVSYPKLQLRGWLHLQGKKDRILGAERQVLAVDFVERCLEPSYPNNPAPPVDSRAKTVGPLCWSAFDLFGSGVRSRINEINREAARLKDGQKGPK